MREDCYKGALDKKREKGEWLDKVMEMAKRPYFKAT